MALGRPPPGPLGSPLYPRPQPDQPGHISGTRKGNLGPVFFKSFFGMTGSAWSVGNNVEGVLSHRRGVSADTNRDARRVSRFSWSPSMSMSVREPWALCTVRACVRLQSQGEQRRRLSPPRTFQARSEDSAASAPPLRQQRPVGRRHRLREVTREQSSEHLRPCRHQARPRARRGGRGEAGRPQRSLLG